MRVVHVAQPSVLTEEAVIEQSLAFWHSLAGERSFPGEANAHVDVGAVCGPLCLILSQVDSAHLPPPPPKKRDSHKVTVRVRSAPVGHIYVAILLGMLPGAAVIPSYHRF